MGDAKMRTLLIKVLSGIFGVSALVCLIVNLAVSRNISWALYPLISIVFVYLLVVPGIYFNKHMILASLISLSVFIFPYLLLIDILTGPTSWFIPIALPEAIIVLVSVWIIFLLVKFSKLSKFIIIRVGLVLTAVISIVSEILVNNFTKSGFAFLDVIITVAALAGCGVIGYFIEKKVKSNESSPS